MCPRDRARTIRGIVDHKIRPLYKTLSVEVPAGCPLQRERDMYHIHEQHKTEESYARWACDFCGKTFYAESFLDDHMQNRHADQIYQGADSVCLSDYCHLFRCDVVSRRLVGDFWDTALCIDDDMTSVIDECHDLFRSCLPQNLTTNSTVNLFRGMKRAVCSHLTCSRYWDTGQVDATQWRMLLKTFLTVLLVGGMIVYYFLAYHHFYCQSLLYSPEPRRRFTEYRKPMNKRCTTSLPHKSTQIIYPEPS